MFKVTLPWLVNLIALLHKLSNICSIRIGSPINQVSKGSFELTCHLIPLLTALCSNILFMRVIKAPRSNAIDSITNFWDSIFDISRMSLIKFNKLLDDEFILSK